MLCVFVAAVRAQQPRVPCCYICSFLMLSTCYEQLNDDGDDDISLILYSVISIAGY